VIIVSMAVATIASLIKTRRDARRERNAAVDEPVPTTGE
jgi:hypothetical protein